jgi:hypothetical protein
MVQLQRQLSQIGQVKRRIQIFRHEIIYNFIENFPNIRTDCMFDMPSGSFPNYNHEKYGDNPGQLWTADDQCRILLRDRKAYAFISNDLSVGFIFNLL